MLSVKEKETQNRYNLNSTEWLNASGGEKRPPYWPGEMSDFVNLLPGHLVLDLGSGPGTDSSRLKEFGLSVYSLDYSRSMLKIAKQLDSGLNLVEANSYETPFPDKSFDGIWFCASLLHMENPIAALLEVHRLLKSNGVCFVSVKEGDGEKVDGRSGYYFNYFHNNELIEIFESLGFKVKASGKREGTPNHPWLTYQIVKV